LPVTQLPLNLMHFFCAIFPDSFFFGNRERGRANVNETSRNYILTDDDRFGGEHKVIEFMTLHGCLKRRHKSLKCMNTIINISWEFLTENCVRSLTFPRNNREKFQKLPLNRKNNAIITLHTSRNLIIHDENNFPCHFSTTKARLQLLFISTLCIVNHIKTCFSVEAKIFIGDATRNQARGR
jgi:hypothetical protein